MPLNDIPAMLLQPNEKSVRADLALEALIHSIAAYAGPGIGVDDLRANNAAKVYLSICLGLHEAGVLSIQHVPALWIDIGDQAYKVSLLVGCIETFHWLSVKYRFPSRGQVMNRNPTRANLSTSAAFQATNVARTHQGLFILRMRGACRFGAKSSAINTWRFFLRLLRI